MTATDPTTCGAKTSAGNPCRRPAGWGTDHVGVGRCKLHGGASPQAQVAGTVILARREAAIMGIPIDVPPHEAILECIRITAGEVAYCSEQIANLQTPMVSTMFGPQLDTWITTRQKAMDRLVLYSATALKAGVEDRRVAAAERAGETLAVFARSFLARLGMSEDPKALAALRAELLVIDSTATEQAA